MKGAPAGWRSQLVPTLFLCARPAVLLRALNRFQRLAGFDRAVGLSASALTALIPLAIVFGAVVSLFGGSDAAQMLIERFDLTGGGAEAVRDALAPPSGSSTDVGLFGLFFLVFAVLSFTRGVQRLFESAWDLKPLSVRNTPNSLLWIAGLSAYFLVSGWIRAWIGEGGLEIDASIAVAPLAVAFLVWSGWLLSAKRIAWQELLPFAVIGATLLAAYSVAAAIYVPHLFSSYATRYGVIGAAFAMITALFCVMVIVVGAAALGRELGDELDRLRRGERPPDDEVRREWDALLEEGRSRWTSARTAAGRWRRPREHQDPPADGA